MSRAERKEKPVQRARRKLAESRGRGQERKKEEGQKAGMAVSRIAGRRGRGRARVVKGRSKGREVGGRRLYQSLNALWALHPENFCQNMNANRSGLEIMFK